MGSYDYIRDLTGFMEKGNYKESVKNLIDFAKIEGWEDQLKEHKLHNSDNTYFELSIPKNASDEQLKTIIEITGAYFCKIVEYVDVKKFVYIKFNHEFWGNKLFKAMKEEGIIEDRGPFVNGEKKKGKYFVQKPPKGRKSATIRDVEAGLNKVVELSIKYIKEYPEFSFLGKTYFNELSASPIILKQYIENCKNIFLQEEIVDSSNVKKITSKLKKMKSENILREGDKFMQISFKEDDLEVKEIQGFFNLLKVKPFIVFEMVSEINGEAVSRYYPEYHTF